MNIIQQHLEHGGGHHLPTGIIVHSMGEKIKAYGKVYDAADWLDYLKLSAHALVLPNGDVIRCRHDDEIAWHSKGFNTGYLGIEFLVEGVHTYGSFLSAIKTDYVTPQQYASGVEVVKTWMENHDVTKIKRHSDIDPGRKVDPGSGFKWTQWLHDIS